MGERDNYCVMLVTNDEYQLPLANADSFTELARITGISYTALQKSYHSGKAVRLPKKSYCAPKGLVIRIKLDDGKD
ncbi:MAG: hypothetical protein NC078_03365 [Ruminococcus sp.]|nr:hypothetical protein [Ruminococcus sp.]